MMRAGRNDPCPCGSGRKYKKCCLGRDRAAARPRPSDRAVGRALDWLLARHRRAVDEALKGDFFALGPDAARRPSSPGLEEMLTVNAFEHLLAEGELELPSGRRPVVELLLGPGGPLFEAEERAWIEEMARRPLRLYEVLRAEPGEGMELGDALEAGADPVWVRERRGSQGMVRRDLLAARVVFFEDCRQLSGAIYAFPRRDLAELRRRVRDELAAPRSPIIDPRSVVSRAIIGCWLEQFEPEPLPEMVDAGTGDPLLLVTDRYRVRDWRALEAALAGRDDVDGGREEGWAWFEELGGGARRSRLGLEPGDGDRLAVFARTLRRADQGRAWLAEVVGDALEFRSREVVDPQSPGVLEPSSESRAAPPVSVPLELQQEVHEHLYRDWERQPIPALGGKTPRQAVRSRAGREQVVELLRDYENHEARRARKEEREPVDFGFLWRSVGLDRDELA